MTRRTKSEGNRCRRCADCSGIRGAGAGVRRRACRASGPSGRSIRLLIQTSICCLAIALASGLCGQILGQATADDAARQAMQQGGEAMAAGNFSAAIAAYNTVTEKLPKFAEGYFNLGLALEQADRLDDAHTALEKAIELKPGLRGANLFLGIVDYRQNQFKEAETRLTRETEIDPHSAKAFMWLGVCRLAEGDAQGATGPLDKAYALDPKDEDILYHRGRAYMLVANASYDAMFKVDPDSIRVHQVLAEAYAQSYRNQESVNEFELAVKMAPHQPGLHEELADQYWVVGNMDKAEADYREELAIDPYATTAKYKLGSLLVLNQNSAEGVKLLRDALHADPGLSDAHYYLGTGLMATDERQQAIREFRWAIAADPKNDRAMLAYYKLAKLYRGMSDKADEESAMQNFLRMRAEEKQRQDAHSVQVARSRSELPVEDPELAAVAQGQAVQ